MKDAEKLILEIQIPRNSRMRHTGTLYHAARICRLINHAYDGISVVDDQLLVPFAFTVRGTLAY